MYSWIAAADARDGSPWIGPCPDQRLYATARVTARLIGLVSVYVSLQALGCSVQSRPAGDSVDGGALGDPDVYLLPNPAHSGFDGANQFRVPMISSLDGGTWSVRDPGIATVAPATAPPELGSSDAWALVTFTGSGTTEVVWTLGDRAASATLMATSYLASDTALGDVRYHDPADPGPTRVACASCHESADGPDHSPLTASVYGDDDLLAIITTGRFPDNLTLSVQHRWDLTSEERVGIAAYLRSLPPRGFSP